MKKIIYFVFIFSCTSLFQVYGDCSCKSGCCSCKSCSSSKKSTTCSCGSASCLGCSTSRGRNNSYSQARPSTSFLKKDDFSSRARRAEVEEVEISDEISEVYKRLQNKALVESGEVIVEEQEDNTIYS